MTALTNGAKPGAADSDGNTACTSPHWRRIPSAGLPCGDMPRRRSTQSTARGHAARGSACATANWDLARFLLDRGAKIETGHAQPALVAAANIAEDDAQGVKLLLKRKARPDANGPLARTLALMTAALNGHADIARALLGAGAKVDLAGCARHHRHLHGSRAFRCARGAGRFPGAPTCTRCGRRQRTQQAGHRQPVQAGWAKSTVRRLAQPWRASCELTASDGRRAVDFAAAAGRWNIVALLDPQYPLPANLSAGEPVAPGADSPAHLLDALRFAHWNTWTNSPAAVRGPGRSRNAPISSAAAGQPRRLRVSASGDSTQGLDPAAALSNGTPLLTALLADLPTSMGAVADLHAAGAQTAGSNALVRLCACPTLSGDAANMLHRTV